MSHRIAVIQMCSTADVDANLNLAERLVAEAAEAGSQMVVLPENFACLGHPDLPSLAAAEASEHRVGHWLARLARRYRLWLVGGTLPTRLRPDGTLTEARIRSACYVWDEQGRERARYDKIHLFDVDVADTKGRYRESEIVEPGERAVVVDTPLGRLGLSVCYDLRFPELYRQLVEQGAELLAIPSAFTRATGRAHWLPLLQARAIENGCYVLAPNQEGRHSATRDSWGHSMILDPWGDILAQQREGNGVVQAMFERTRLQEVRERIPALWHRRL